MRTDREEWRHTRVKFDYPDSGWHEGKGHPRFPFPSLLQERQETSFSRSEEARC